MISRFVLRLYDRMSSRRSLLFCLLQALVFTMLLSIYVSEAVEEEE